LTTFTDLHTHTKCVRTRVYLQMLLVMNILAFVAW